MLSGKVAIIGLGAIGVPIADKLYAKYHDDFVLVANSHFKEKLTAQKMFINGKDFSPRIISDKSNGDNISLLIICIKNYDLQNALDDIKNVVTENTVILPLQNGIFSYEFFRENFPKNSILQGYVIGPNTVINNGEFYYKNPGVMHIGSPDIFSKDIAYDMYKKLKDAGIDIIYEENITREAWKKWMLNVAGNSITALTNADYSSFKDSEELQELSRRCMTEFLKVANAENVELYNDDIDNIINYYVTYSGHKKTSMLVDVVNKKKTENDYLAGDILSKAKKHNIDMPITETLYFLIKIKERIYLK